MNEFERAESVRHCKWVDEVNKLQFKLKIKKKNF